MQVLVQVNEADVGNVVPGQKIRFTTDTFQNRTFRGEVRKVRLNAAMTQNVVTYTVEIVTENPDLVLLPYLTANVRFEVAKHDAVLAVPNAALRWSPRAAAAAAPPGAMSAGPTGPTAGTGGTGASGPTEAPPTGGRGPGQGRRGGSRSEGEGGGRTGTVYVLKDGVPQPVQVKAGLSDGTVTEITGDGVVEGMEVVVGEVSIGAPAAATGATNPFAPPVMRGGGGGRGGR
jgi:HlyD family secretion protein